MKIVLYVIANAAACFMAQLFFPWWSAAMVCLAAGFLIRRVGMAWLTGLAPGLLWLLVALYFDHENQSLLSRKINLLLPANALFLTTLTGCLVGGMACASGAVMREFFQPIFNRRAHRGIQKYI